jgi:Transposase IS66 family/Family of unknown function (DUF6444)
MKHKPDPEEQAQLNQLSKEELVSLVMEARQKLKELEERIIQLTISLNLDSKTSSKPPSTDLLKKSEKPKPTSQEEESKPKRKPGGQPGHQGSTRKGFNRIDRVSILSPVQCSHCGTALAETTVVKTEKQQVAQLVARPIEIVEYHRQHCQCAHCGQVSAASWDSEMIPGQDLGIKLQGLLGWLGTYAHLPYEKQQELLWELGEIEVGVGTLVSTNQRVNTGIAPSVTELETWIQETQPDIHVDETPCHFQKLELQPGLYNRDIAQVFLNLIDEAFRHHRIWRETEGQDQYRNWATDFQNRVNQQIANWKVKAGQRAGQLLRSLQEKQQQWWYFLKHPHIPPDNNLAERYLRLAVTKRKISGGSRSMERFEQTAKLLSVVQTCRRQGRSVIAFFGQALKATLGLDVVPSLIPSSST